MLWDVGGDEGGPAWAGIDEGEFMLVGVDDAARAAGALAAVGGHGCYVREGGGDEAAVVAVREVGGGEGRGVAGDVEGEGDVGVGAHGPGDHQGGRLVVDPLPWLPPSSVLKGWANPSRVATRMTRRL